MFSFCTCYTRLHKNVYCRLWRATAWSVLLMVLIFIKFNEILMIFFECLYECIISACFSAYQSFALWRLQNLRTDTNSNTCLRHSSNENDFCIIYSSWLHKIIRILYLLWEILCVKMLLCIFEFNEILISFMRKFHTLISLTVLFTHSSVWLIPK